MEPLVKSDATMSGERGPKLSVLNVPAEVLQAVGGWLKPEEREQVRLACRHFHDSFTSELLTLLVRPQSVTEVSWQYVKDFFKRFPHSTKAMLYLTGHWGEAHYHVLAQHVPLIPNRVKKLTVLAGAGFQLADPSQLDSHLLRPLATLKQLEELEVVSVQADTSFLKHLTRLTYLVLAPCTPAPDYFWVSLFVKSQIPQLFSTIPSSGQHWRSLSSLQQLSIELPTPAATAASGACLPTARDVIHLLQPVQHLLHLQKFLLGLSSSVLLQTGIQASEPARVAVWLLEVLPSLLYVKLRNVQYEQEKMHLEMQDPDDVQDVPALWGSISWQCQRLAASPASPTSFCPPSPSHTHPSSPSSATTRASPAASSFPTVPLTPSVSHPAHNSTNLHSHPGTLPLDVHSQCDPSSPVPTSSLQHASLQGTDPTMVQVANAPQHSGATARGCCTGQHHSMHHACANRQASAFSMGQQHSTDNTEPGCAMGQHPSAELASSTVQACPAAGSMGCAMGQHPSTDLASSTIQACPTAGSMGQLPFTCPTATELVIEQITGSCAMEPGVEQTSSSYAMEPAAEQANGSCPIAHQGAVELSLWVPPSMSLSDALDNSLKVFRAEQVVKLELVHFKSKVTDIKTLTRLSRLTCLYLNGAYSTAALVRQLSGLKSLQELQLDGYVDDGWRATHNITTTVSLRPQSAALLAQALPALKFLGCEGRISRGALHPLVDLSQLQGLSVMDLPTTTCCSMRRSTPMLHSLPTTLTCIDLFDVQLVGPSGNGPLEADGTRAVSRQGRSRRQGQKASEAKRRRLAAAAAQQAPPMALPHLCMLKLTRCSVDSLAMLSSCSRLQCVLVADCKAVEGTADIPHLASLWPGLRRLECVEDSQPHNHSAPAPARSRFFDFWAQDSSLAALTALKDLKHFAAIQVNGEIASHISNTGVAALAHLTALRSLSLEIGGSATEQSITSLADMSWLRTLELRVPEHMEYSNVLTKLRAHLPQAEVAVSNQSYVSIC